MNTFLFTCIFLIYFATSADSVKITTSQFNIPSTGRAQNTGYNKAPVNSTSPQDNEKNPTILGGYNASKKTAKYIASLIIKTSESTFQCTGSILNSKTILSAAHCFVSTTQRTITSVYVTAGTKSSQLNSAYIVKNVLIHTSYNPSTFAYDAALITIHGNLKKKKYSSMVFYTNPLYRIPSNTVIFNNGFGYKTPSGPSSVRLLEVKLINLASSSVSGGCPANVLCLADEGYPNTGVKGICSGDSGGPSYVKDDGDYVQVGIISYGFRDSNGNCVLAGGYYGSFSISAIVDDFVPNTVASKWLTVFQSQLAGINID